MGAPLHLRFVCLPSGDLTSQFLANVYRDALDRFVYHVPRARYDVRYCDDLVLLSMDRVELVAWEQAILAFLRDKLALSPNSRRRLGPVSDGIDFLGLQGCRRERSSGGR